MVPQIIRADYPVLEQVAAKFDEEHERIMRIKQVLDHQLHILRRGGWDTEAATAFYREMDNDVLPAVIRLAKALDQGAQTSREIIRLLKAAEEDAAAQLRGSDENIVRPTKELRNGGGGIVNNDLTSTAKNPAFIPRGVTFTGIYVPSLEGIPRRRAGAQYETIERMSAEDRQAADLALDDPNTLELEGLKNNDDYNSCGPLVIAAVANMLGIDVSAGRVFSDFVVLNADSENFDPAAVTTLRHLIPLASSFGIQTNLILDNGSIMQETPRLNPETGQTQIERTVVTERDAFIEIVSNELANGYPLAALINIDQNGIAIDDSGGTNHWVAVTGIGEGENGSHYVRIWNSMHNRQEYYEIGFFIESFVSGPNTLVSFSGVDEA